ncbi:MAG: response regulator [Bacteroidia bacterium]|jgi:CheY-like chemotaxis protein|nr:response regulator [Bacteroidia bacterium]
MLNILIIDDDPLTRRALFFEISRAGHHVEAAADAYDGLKMTELGNYDLIICDIILPQISGLVLSALLQQFSNRKIPLLLMSSTKEFKSFIEQQDFGAMGFMHKPVKRPQLNMWLNRIEELKGE